MNFVKRDGAVHPVGTRDYFNSSILGNGLVLRPADWLILLLRVIFAALGVGVAVAAVPYYRDADPLFWLQTSSGVLLTASWLVLSLGQSTTR